jgi:UMF1 family MFS transporter
MVVVSYFGTTQAVFWVAANLAGLAMGSSQSAGRALVAYFSPPGRSAEFFGLWGVATRLASILGPVTYGAVVYLTAENSHRLESGSQGVFPLVGLAQSRRSISSGAVRRPQAAWQAVDCHDAAYRRKQCCAAMASPSQDGSARSAFR